MRRKGSFTPSTGERDVLKNVYDQTVTAKCEEVFTEVSIKRAHLECRHGELCTRKVRTYTTVNVRVYKLYSSRNKLSISLDWKKSIELQKIYISFVAGPSGCAVYGVGLRPLAAETVGSSPTGGMDICLL